MAEPVIELTIRPDGRVEVHVEGVDGLACLSETADLIQRLGGEVEEQELTADAYAEGEQQDRQQVGR